MAQVYSCVLLYLRCLLPFNTRRMAGFFSDKASLSTGAPRPP